MFGITLRRPAAALGVVAGLLAAAAPAGAQFPSGFAGVDVSADHIEYVVTDNKDPDAVAIARGTQIGIED